MSILGDTLAIERMGTGVYGYGYGDRPISFVGSHSRLIRPQLGVRRWSACFVLFERKVLKIQMLRTRVPIDRRMLLEGESR